MQHWVCMLQNYRATIQQEEQHTPAFLRMQHQAEAKEAEEAAEKKRIWEEEVASKKFWVRLACPCDALYDVGRTGLPARH